MEKPKVHVDKVRMALEEMGYREPEVLINHLQVEEDDDSEFSVATIKEIAFTRLDFNYEEVLLSKLGIA